MTGNLLRCIPPPFRQTAEDDIKSFILKQLPCQSESIFALSANIRKGRKYRQGLQVQNYVIPQAKPTSKIRQLKIIQLKPII